MNHLVDLFLRYGVRNIALLVGQEFREDFEWWKKRYYSMPSKNSPSLVIFEEKEPLGTFGGLYFLREWIGQDSFFLTNGDELKDVDLNQMEELHRTRGSLGTIALVKVPNPQEYGVVVCEGDTVRDFVEKPSAVQIVKLQQRWGGKKTSQEEYINSGLYILSPEIFRYQPGPKFMMIEKDIFPNLAKEGKLGAFKFQGRWMDCGTWDRYKRALEEWEKGSSQLKC